MTRCHVCDRPREPEDDYLVAMRNHLYVDACFRCWFMWPDEHKTWPAFGYGRSKGSPVADDLLVALLGGPA